MYKCSIFDKYIECNLFEEYLEYIRRYKIFTNYGYDTSHLYVYLNQDSLLLAKGMATHSSIFAGEFHGQRGLAGYSPRGRKESNMTERPMLPLSLFITLIYGSVSFEMGYRPCKFGRSIYNLGKESRTDVFEQI